MDKSTGAHKESDTDRETHVAKLPAHIFSADVNKTFPDLQFIAFQKCIISFQIPMVSLHLNMWPVRAAIAKVKSATALLQKNKKIQWIWNQHKRQWSLSLKILFKKKQHKKHRLLAINL